MPVHHDDEYRIRLEKDELLRRLGIGVDPEEYRQTSLLPAFEKTEPDLDRRIVSKDAEWFEGGVGTNLVAYLRLVVMQNELVLCALKRLEEAGSARPRPFNPADWK